MLTLAELTALSGGQDQRVVLGEIWPRDGTNERLLEVRQRRVAVIEKGLGVEFNFARRRREPGWDAIRLLGVFVIPRLQGHAYATGVLAQGIERDARGAKLVTVGGVDIAVPEVRPET